MVAKIPWRFLHPRLLQRHSQTPLIWVFILITVVHMQRGTYIYKLLPPLYTLNILLHDALFQFSSLFNSFHLCISSSINHTFVYPICICVYNSFGSFLLGSFFNLLTPLVKFTRIEYPTRASCVGISFLSISYPFVNLCHFIFII